MIKKANAIVKEMLTDGRNEKLQCYPFYSMGFCKQKMSWINGREMFA
jgi:hypothetical protein